jgi:WhiB family transcriptional regulator, redox-sensing transcriptional regulator
MPANNYRRDAAIDIALRHTTLTAAAAEHGVKEASLAQTLRRAGRTDLVTRLTGHQPLNKPRPAPPARPPEPQEEEGPDLSWHEQALCAQTDPEAFFPDKGGSTRQAKQVCMRCPVRVQCLNYALENDERFGIWGGLSERERRRVKKAAV